MNFTQVSKYLDDALIFGIKPSLIRIEKILELMGDPHKSSDYIHIVGTNGKTSTAIILANILKKIGFRSGYHISPHIDSYTERIWLDGSDISEDRFTDAFNRMYPYIGEVNDMDLGGPITQFEIISALAFMIARDEKIRVMVLEAGMGGRWDATNIADSRVSGLTGVSLEHTDILGDTIAEIAAEKVEVIKEGASAATLSRDPEVLNILRKKVKSAGASCYLNGSDFKVAAARSRGLSGWVVDIDGIYGRYPGIKLPLPGDYQPSNLLLAVALAELYMEIEGEKIDPGSLKESLSDIYVKGRFEILKEAPFVIADASHNPEGTIRFCHTAERYFGLKRKTIIFAVLADKDYRQMIEQVIQTADRLILTSSGNSRSLPLERLREETASIMGEHHGRGNIPGEVYAIDTIENSLNYALKISDTNDIICITGSITNLEHLDRIFNKN